MGLALVHFQKYWLLNDPQGILKESLRNPQGILKESSGNSQVIPKESQGIPKESSGGLPSGIPQGIKTFLHCTQPKMYTYLIIETDINFLSN